MSDSRHSDRLENDVRLSEHGGRNGESCFSQLHPKDHVSNINGASFSSSLDLLVGGEKSQTANHIEDQQQEIMDLPTTTIKSKNAELITVSGERLDDISTNRSPSSILSTIGEEELSKLGAQVTSFSRPTPELNCTCQGVTAVTLSGYW